MDYTSLLSSFMGSGKGGGGGPASSATATSAVGSTGSINDAPTGLWIAFGVVGVALVIGLIFVFGRK